MFGSNLPPRCFYWTTNTHEQHNRVQDNSTELTTHAFVLR